MVCLTQTAQIYAEVMKDRTWTYDEEYAEAYIASLVCCRPDGERKRSVRVVCVISIYLLGAPHGLCVFCVVCVRQNNRCSLSNAYVPTDFV